MHIRTIIYVYKYICIYIPSSRTCSRAYRDLDRYIYIGMYTYVYTYICIYIHHQAPAQARIGI